MAVPFDPWHTWLGIPPDEQPPDHYRLLGVTRFEMRRDVISHASDQRLAYLRSVQLGPHGQLAQGMQSEVAKATSCLLNPRRKSLYDEHLRARDNAVATQAALTPPAEFPVFGTVGTAANWPVQISPAGGTTPSSSRSARRMGRHWILLGSAAFSFLATIAILMFWMVGIGVREDDATGKGLRSDRQRPSGQSATSPAVAVKPRAPGGPSGDSGKNSAKAASAQAEPSRETVASAVPSAVVPEDTAPASELPSALGPSRKSGEPLEPATPGIPRTETVSSPNVVPASEPPQPAAVPTKWQGSGAPSAATSTPPANPATLPQPAVTVGDQGPSRLPVPEKESLEAARGQLKKLLGEEDRRSKDSRPPVGTADIERLLALAAESGTDAAHRYILLEEASRRAASRGDLSKGVSIIRDLARQFDISPGELLAECCARAGEAARTAADRRQVAQVALELVDELRIAGAWDAALQVVQVAVASATRAKESELAKLAREVRDELQEVRKDAREAEPSRNRLSTGTGSAADETTWGRFACFRRRDWVTGLPHLAKGTESALATAAGQDLRGAASLNDRLAIGEAWARQLKNVLPKERESVALRALHWYQQAHTEATGLVRLDLEQRIQELEAEVAPRLRPSAKGPRPATLPAYEPPTGFTGMLGRIQSQGADTGIVWNYPGGQRLTQATLTQVLSPAGVPPGRLRIEFVGLIMLPESATLNIDLAGGSQSAKVTLFIDQQPWGEVGGTRNTQDVYKAELNAGQHLVRWILEGEELGTASLKLTNAASGKPAILFHTPEMLTTIRDTPTRARLNVSMSGSR